MGNKREVELVVISDVHIGTAGYHAIELLKYRACGIEPVSFSKKIKHSVKGAVKYINSFEETAARLAAGKGYNTLVCGHIHQP